MKKVLITMALLISLMASGMVFSSFTAPKQDAKEKSEHVEVNVPVYWEGGACYSGRGDDYLYIKVYQTEGQCNSFYAVVTGAYFSSNVGKELWVRPNPDYNPDKYDCCYKKYLVSCGGRDYFFNM